MRQRQRACVENANDIFVLGRHEHGAIGGEMQGARAGEDVGQGRKGFRPGARVPQGDLAVLGAGGEESGIGRPGAGEDVIGVGVQGGKGLAGLGVGDEGVGRVAYDCAKAAVGGCGGGVEGVGVGEGFGESLGREVHESEALVVGTEGCLRQAGAAVGKDMYMGDEAVAVVSHVAFRVGARGVQVAKGILTVKASCDDYGRVCRGETRSPDWC